MSLLIVPPPVFTGIGARPKPTVDELPKEGFGAAATGGAGGAVFPVVNTNDGGAGSLRQAIAEANAASGPAIVDVQVGGLITLDSTIKVTGKRITLTGANAPSPFLIRGNQTSGRWMDNSLVHVTKGASDILIEHLRFAHGLGDPDSQNGKNLLLTGGDGVYIRHCSFAWADDEIFTCFGQATNVTMQYCLFYEGLANAHHNEGGFEKHNFGTVVDDGLHDVRFTMAHCVMAHLAERMPVLCRLPATEWINVVNYHWSTSSNASAWGRGDGIDLWTNIRGCMWLEGPDASGSFPITSEEVGVSDYMFLDDCLWQKDDFSQETDPRRIHKKGTRAPLSATPITFNPPPPVPVTVLAREDVWAHLEPRVGAFPRSASDTRVLQHVANAIDQVSLDGAMPDSVAATDDNRNPRASVTLYRTWSEAL